MQAIPVCGAASVADLTVIRRPHSRGKFRVTLLCDISAVVSEERALVEAESPLRPLIPPARQARGLGVHQQAVEVEHHHADLVTGPPRLDCTHTRILAESTPTPPSGQTSPAAGPALRLLRGSNDRSVSASHRQT